MITFTRYLPISEPIFASSVYLTGAGVSIVPAGSPYPPKGHPELYDFSWQDGRVLPEFSLLWITQGSGIWETEFGVFPICAGQVGQVFPGAWHRYRPDPGTGWTECWLQFNGRLAHELEDDSLAATGTPVTTPHRPEPFFRQFQELLEDIRPPTSTNSALYGLRVVGLLGLLHPPAPGSVGGSSLVERALEHIWSYSHRQLGVSEVADRLGVSRRTLERAFAADGRKGVLEEITRCRLNRAERLLRETPLPLKNIASLAGFGTVEHMRLQFQSRHGQTPGSYRKIHPARLRP